MSTYPNLDKYHAHRWVYSSSKTALNYAMMAFATELPDIKTALIHPGWMKTDMEGKDAPLDSSISAKNIYSLIADHTNKLPNKKLVSHEGELLEI